MGALVTLPNILTILIMLTGTPSWGLLALIELIMPYLIVSSVPSSVVFRLIGLEVLTRFHPVGVLIDFIVWSLICSLLFIVISLVRRRTLVIN